MNDSKNTFSNFTDEELRSTLREINSMDQEQVMLLKAEFMNREMFEESFSIDTFYSSQFDPSKLSLNEIQQLVSERLQTGESIESIKLDLADHGITLENMVNKESERMDTIEDKIHSGLKSGKSEDSINAELKKEYNYSDEEVIEVKKNLKSRSRWYVIIGICAVLFYVARLLIKILMH